MLPLVSVIDLVSALVLLRVAGLGCALSAVLDLVLRVVGSVPDSTSCASIDLWVRDALLLVRGFVCGSLV